MSDTVYITTYFNQYGEDGYEIGDVYRDEEDAEAAAEAQDDIDYGWAMSSVIERELNDHGDDEREIRELTYSQLEDYQEENPLVACRDEEKDTCAYKREYENRLQEYKLGGLRRWPDCEACGCPLILVFDTGGNDE